MNDHPGQIADRPVDDPAFVQIGAAAHAIRHHARAVDAKAAHQLFGRPAGGAHGPARQHRDPPDAEAVGAGQILGQCRA